MNKKITGLIAIISIVLAIVLGICFLRLGDQSRQNESDEIQSATTTESAVETSVEPTTEPIVESDEKNQETDTMQEQQAENKQQEEKTVRIVEEEEVRDNPTFAAFIDKEITAYDDVEEKNWYIYEYFADYSGVISGVHYMAEDLNQDTKNELLLYIEATWGFGNLLVFEETENGELIAWEVWEYILNDRQPYIYYCGNGTFMMHGGLGISVGHYTQEGTPELLIDYYHEITEFNDIYYTVIIWLKLYEDGEEVKEMEYECYCDIETNEDIIELESETAKEGEKLIDEMLTTLTEEKAVSFDSLNGAEYRDEYRDKVKTVLLEELKRPKE